MDFWERVLFLTVLRIFGSYNFLSAELSTETVLMSRPAWITADIDFFIFVLTKNHVLTKFAAGFNPY